MATIGPVSERERIRELDILRGFALFGVLVVNFVAFAGPEVIATEAQLNALPTVALDRLAHFAIVWLAEDKANTMFATLFGLGFYIQMSRGEGKPGFEARYSRRLFWLLVFGWLNATLLWIWDILNLYAVAGFALLLMRSWRTRSLVIFGTVCALYSDKLQDWWLARMGWDLVPDSWYMDPAVLQRQETALHGSYFDNVVSMWQWTWAEWLAGGLIGAWIVYALGRFALGAAIGRSGILEDIPGHLPLLKRIAWIAIPAGLIISLVIKSMAAGLWGEDAETVGDILRSPAALLLAAGYASAIVVALHGGRGSRLWKSLAPVGQMALTNYLAQGLIYAFILFGVGPGLGLAGSIGSFAVVLISVAFFALQIAFSHWWLSRYRFGPMEWVWRTLTYGERPRMRRAEPVPAAA
jgi:uncharacterized protein